MKQPCYFKRVLSLFVLTMWILPLAGGCMPLERQDLTEFVEGLLRSAVAAFLL